MGSHQEVPLPGKAGLESVDSRGCLPPLAQRVFGGLSSLPNGLPSFPNHFKMKFRNYQKSLPKRPSKLPKSISKLPRAFQNEILKFSENPSQNDF